MFLYRTDGKLLGRGLDESNIVWHDKAKRKLVWKGKIYTVQTATRDAIYVYRSIDDIPASHERSTTSDLK